MPNVDLDAIRVTTERVERFLADLESDPTDANRERWRGAMDDLRHCIRHARAAGLHAEEIHQATGGLRTGRFLRPAPAEAEVPLTPPIL